MCGITGVLHRTSGSADRDVVRRMRDVIAYRGPDSAGEYVNGPVGLGIRRLAIIDLSSGTQPITSSDGRHTIVFNGEIYNYRQLRKPLESLFPFRTQSDTEVLLYHLIAHGAAGVNDLNGMFAFALWDAQKEELFLARDRFGKKPLYYAELPDAFLFGSEPKSLLTYPQFPRTLDDDALTKYFLYEYVPAPQTPYTAIKKLPPGCSLRVTKARAELRQWWTLYPSDTRYAPQPGSKTLAAQFDAHLHAAVQDRMVADVPVGVLLSGGIDSTTIAWYMRQHTKQLHSFSVSFDEGTFDESSYATMAADALGTTHHAIPFSVENFHTTLKRFQKDADEPLGDASF
ncbi:MAG: asparagine synthase, partial [Parcubacteria group bacterium Gr01-1014_106]